MKNLDFDICHNALGNNAAARQSAYSEHTMQTIPDEELKMIREAIQRNQLTGTNAFRKGITRKFGIKISNKGPRKN